MSELQQTVQEIKDKLDMLVQAIMGNLETPNEPGILVRIDRLEQANKYKNRVLWLFGAGLFGMLCNLTVSVLR